MLLIRLLKFPISVVILLQLFCKVGWASESDKILVSIKPLQLIVSEISGSAHKIELILNASKSPHTYNLKPSDIRKINDANIVFWIGPSLEFFLKKHLSYYDEFSVTHNNNASTKKKQSKTIVTLINNPQLSLRSRSKSNNHNHHHHHHGEYDPHIWLSPTNAIEIAKHVATVLIHSNPINKQIYKDNLASFIAKVNVTNQINNKKISAITNRGFFVFHDAWGYLADYYGINILDIIMPNPEKPIGAKHLIELKKITSKHSDSCIFREPQFNLPYWNQMIMDLNLKSEILDPMASDIKPYKDSYAFFMQSLIESIVSCTLRSTNH